MTNTEIIVNEYAYDADDTNNNANHRSMVVNMPCHRNGEDLQKIMYFTSSSKKDALYKLSSMYLEAAMICSKLAERSDNISSLCGDGDLIFIDGDPDEFPDLLGSDHLILEPD